MTESAQLDGVLAEVAELAGAGAALALAAAKGGVIAYIPQPPHLGPHHWLVRAMGEKAARQVAERFGGGHLKVPLGPLSGHRARLARAIRQGIEQGLSVAEIARLAGTDRSTVQRHKSRTRRPDNKPDNSGQGRLL